ncbi:MAG: alkaline phosphatase family protein, partial [Actinomycetes bacterium]
IQHVVFIMQENRSFDHMYGTLSGVRGFNDRRNNAMRTFKQKKPAGGYVLPYHYDTAKREATCTVSPVHEWAPQHENWNYGHLQFVKAQIANQATLPNVTGPMTMGYYTRQDLPYYYSLADAFTICDNYFSSNIGPTHSNRCYAISGTIDPSGAQGGPCVETSLSNYGKFSWVTAPELLQNAGVSWKVYNPSGFRYDARYGAAAMAASNNILLAYSQYEYKTAKGTPLYNNAFGPQWPNDFIADCANNTLPAVSWIWPGASPGFDEHPSAPISRGEWGTNTALQALFKNKKLWAKTLVIHNYDENGAYFDHVPPLTPPPGTPGEYLTKIPASVGGWAGPIGLGFRVPSLVISPWSRGGYVNSQRLDHCSMLMFLEQRFGIRFDNISAWRRSVVGDMTGTLRMNHKSTSIPKLPHAPKAPKKMKQQCDIEALTIEQGGTAVKPPKKQSMPKQERGKKKKVK